MGALALAIRLLLLDLKVWSVARVLLSCHAVTRTGLLLMVALRNVQMEQKCDFIECDYAKSMSKCSIDRKYKLNESEVCKRMAIAESFILGCLTAADEPLELDLLYGFPCH